MTDKRQDTDESQSTGAGAEAAEGLHSAGDGKERDERSGAKRVRRGDEPGSEPLKERNRNPKGSYGGEGGKARKPPPMPDSEQ